MGRGSESVGAYGNEIGKRVLGLGRRPSISGTNEKKKKRAWGKRRGKKRGRTNCLIKRGPQREKPPLLPGKGEERPGKKMVVGGEGKAIGKGMLIKWGGSFGGGTLAGGGRIGEDACSRKVQRGSQGPETRWGPTNETSIQKKGGSRGQGLSLSLKPRVGDQKGCSATKKGTGRPVQVTEQRKKGDASEGLESKEK